MRTRWVAERSATDVRRVGRRVRKLRGRDSRGELAREVALELDGERTHVLRRIETPPEPHAIGKRQLGAREERAALAEKARVRLDDDRLHRRAGAAGKRARRRGGPPQPAPPRARAPREQEQPPPPPPPPPRAPC